MQRLLDNFFQMGEGLRTHFIYWSTSDCYFFVLISNFSGGLGRPWDRGLGRLTKLKNPIFSSESKG